MLPDSWVRKIPWRRKWQPTPLFLPGKCDGQRSPVSYSPQCRKEANTTERLNNNNIGGDCIIYWLLENRWIFYVLIYVSFTDDGLLACILQYSWHILLVNIVKCLFFWVHSSTADLKRMLFPKNCFSHILLFLICFQL